MTKKERERDMSFQGEVRSSKLHRRIELYVWPIFNCVSNLEQRERRNRVHFELESVIERSLIESRAKRRQRVLKSSSLATLVAEMVVIVFRNYKSLA